jgi:hypothetical protein
MMRYRLLFGAVLSAVALAACGGSSSETPPPLQPDPAGFRYAPPFAAPISEEADAGEAPRNNPAIAEPDPNPKPRVPGRSTWGASPAVH